MAYSIHFTDAQNKQQQRMPIPKKILDDIQNIPKLLWVSSALSEGRNVPSDLFYLRNYVTDFDEMWK